MICFEVVGLRSGKGWVVVGSDFFDPGQVGRKLVRALIPSCPWFLQAFEDETVQVLGDLGVDFPWGRAAARSSA